MRTSKASGYMAGATSKSKSVHFIGKESNKLEEVEEQSVSDAADVYTEYPDPRRDEWATKILPALRTVPVSILMKASGMSRRAIQRIRNDGASPHKAHRKLLAETARILREVNGNENDYE